MELGGQSDSEQVIRIHALDGIEQLLFGGRNYAESLLLASDLQ